MKSIAKLLAVTGLLVLLPAGQALAAGTSDLFVQQPRAGKIERAGKHRFRLVLSPAPKRTVSFTDRPARLGGEMATAKFVSSWRRYGFKQDPPNAALSITGAGKRNDVVLLTLRNPHLEDGDLVYGATPLKGEPRNGLKRFAKRADRVSELKFRDASLFIDPTNAAVAVRLNITDTGASQSLLQINIAPDNELVWATDDGVGRDPGLQIQGNPPGSTPPFSAFALDDRALYAANPVGSPGGAFSVLLYLVGSDEFLEANATIVGWQVEATINGVTTFWSSGVITAALD